ncbi:hypothetical protein MRB53_041159 [Persea americana]|nr:hypothetical protein MRB53_041159 [Persea americana]
MRSALQRSSQSLLRAAITANRNIARPRYIINNISPSFASLSSRQLHSTPRRLQQEVVAEENRPSTDGPVVTKFKDLADLNMVHPNIIRSITEGMGLETMTDVQTQTINAALKGKDIIAQAKTGTGKTMAFLIPLLQNIITVDPALAERGGFRRGPRATADDIRAIVISPTRELAEQIAVEAKRVVQGTGIIVQAAVGGTQKAQGLRAIQREGCHVLVGTPGRLQDILTDEYSRVEAPDLSALVLDEADRLLDQGFGQISRRS